MPSAVAIGQFERRLVELGCPSARIRREVRELAEHHDDLKQNALEEGLSEADADVRADQLIGEPVALAEFVAAALRQSSWWGRHPIIGFCLLPPVGILLLLVLGLGLDSLVGKLYFTQEQLSALADNVGGVKFYSASFESTYYAIAALSAILFCWLARWTGAWRVWSSVACAICALHGLFFYMQIVPHRLTIGYASHSQWISPLIPSLIAMAVFAMHWRAVNLLEPMPAEAGFWRAKKAEAKLKRRAANLPRTGWLTPSSMIAALGIVALVSLAIFLRANLRQQAARSTQLRSTVWPDERAATRARVASRQADKDTVHETIISLASRVNASLTDSLNYGNNIGVNNLAELPYGEHIFGGVPFDVEGRVQLLGRPLIVSGKLFPVQVRDIRIGQRCGNIYLLHGAAFAGTDSDPATIARLMVHYADGSHAEIQIESGRHLLDWWGPIYSTDLIEQTGKLAPGTELAWTGGNPAISRQAPESALRLYRSMFRNPHPELVISSLDYVSTMTNAAPFMVGLTVE